MAGYLLWLKLRSMRKVDQKDLSGSACRPDPGGGLGDAVNFVSLRPTAAMIWGGNRAEGFGGGGQEARHPGETAQGPSP